MKLIVFGANGPTGRLATAHALAAGHEVTAVTRRPDSFPVHDDRLRVVGADVLDAAAVDRAVAGQDAVISVLGVPFGRKPVTVYSQGATHIIRAMTDHGIRRLVCVTSSALSEQEAPGESLLFRKVLEPFVVSVLGRTVYQDMRRMEAIVRASSLDWTIIRPSGLFDTTVVSDYQTSERRLPGRFTSRADLAHSLVSIASGDRYLRSIAEVRTSQNVPSFAQILFAEGLGKKS